MAFLGAMNVSASGMTAQRQRLDVISENIANMNTTRIEGTEGEEAVPYTRKMVVFQPIAQSDFRNTFDTARGNMIESQGVVVTEIVEDDAAYKILYDPNHPDADENGYVEMPNVDSLTETVDAMAASRAYEANVTAFNAIKAMASKGLEIGR